MFYLPSSKKRTSRDNRRDGHEEPMMGSYNTSVSLFGRPPSPEYYTGMHSALALRQTHG